MRRFAREIAVFVVTAFALISQVHSVDLDKVQAVGKSAVAHQLKDPDSVRFRAIFVVPNGQQNADFIAHYVCGMVDGKNSFGAYTGGQRFVARVVEDKKTSKIYPGTVVLDDGDSRATLETSNKKSKETVFESVYWNANCVDAQHPKSFTGKTP